MDIYSKLQQVKQRKKGTLNLIISEENQEILRELKASKKVNVFTPKEFSFIYAPLTEKNYIEVFEKLFWGININEDLEKLYYSPPTSVCIWIDYNYTPCYQWTRNPNDFINLYIVHTKEEFLELMDWFIETLNKSHLFFESYDNDEIISFIENVINKQSEE